MPAEAHIFCQPYNLDVPAEIHHPVLEELLRTTLEKLAGFCLDNESDREALVPLLANALIQATQSGDLILGPYPPEPVPAPETSGSSSPATPAT